MLKVCLDDPEVTQLLFMIAEDMARGIASEASRSFLLATMTQLSGGWSRRHLFVSLGQKLRRHVPHFNSLSRPELGRTAWDMPFGPSPMHTHLPPFCQLTEEVLSAMLSKLLEVKQLQGLDSFRPVRLCTSDIVCVGR